MLQILLFIWIFSNHKGHKVWHYVHKEKHNSFSIIVSFMQNFVHLVVKRNYYTCFNFQPPFRKIHHVTIVMALSATTMATKTPVSCIPVGTASR